MSIEMNVTALSTLEINPKAPATTSLIWLHGLGATNEDFFPIGSQLQQLTGVALRFVFPQAPLRPVTVNNGYVMPAWYDITSFDRKGAVDQEGIIVSIHQINALIEKELKRGFTAANILLAGFSQGAVIALSTMLAYPQALGGVIALSGYLPAETLSPAKHSTPIFLAHGLLDDVVPVAFGQTACDRLIKANYPVSWHTYPMPHAVCDEEIRDVGKWLKSI